MSRGEWNKKEELLAEQAAKHLRHYTPLLAAFAKSTKAELALLSKVIMIYRQIHCPTLGLPACPRYQKERVPCMFYNATKTRNEYICRKVIF